MITYKNYIKRAMDIALAGGILIATSPALFLSALAIRDYDGGGVFYRGQRVGRHGKAFEIYKLRTMKEGADNELPQILSQYPDGDQWDPRVIKDDPRVTPIGRILRKFHLDEAPQAINVLRGDMSIVGPRPPSRQEDDIGRTEYGRQWWSANGTLPGITGYAAVNGGRKISPSEKRALECSYTPTFAGDMKILYQTLGVLHEGD